MQRLLPVEKNGSVVPNAYHTVFCAVGQIFVRLSLNTQVLVERHWGPPGVNGVAVTWGSLLFALPLDENIRYLHSPFDRCFESGCSRDIEITSTVNWAHALVLRKGDVTGHSVNSTVFSPESWQVRQ
eukprot:SAG31_NODE_15058_length_773_cov_0.682493_1_plen_126_part_10